MKTDKNNQVLHIHTGPFGTAEKSDKSSIACKFLLRHIRALPPGQHLYSVQLVKMAHDFLCITSLRKSLLKTACVCVCVHKG